MALTMLRYRQSMIGSLDVVHAERQLRDIQNRLIDTRNQLRKAVLSIRQAMGSLRCAHDVIEQQPIPQQAVDGRSGRE